MQEEDYRDQTLMNQGDPTAAHPEDALNPFEKLLVGWIWPLIELATTRTLTEDDLLLNPKRLTVKELTRVVVDAWEGEKTQALAEDREPYLGFAIWKAFERFFYISLFLHFIFAVIQLSQPYVIGEIVDYIVTGKQGLSYGIGMAILLAVLSVASSLSLTSFLFMLRRLGIAVRSGLMHACYEHTLRLSALSRQSLTVGKTTSLVSIDCEKIFMCAQYWSFLLHGPFAAIAVMCLLILEVGWMAGLAGMFFLIALIIPTQRYIAANIGQTRRRMIKCTDERVKLINEMLSAIRAIKFYSWEIPLLSRILQTRTEEMKHLVAYLDLSGLLREVLYGCGPTANVIMFSIVIYAQGNGIDIAQAFRVLSLINILRFPLNLLGVALKTLNDAMVSTTRLNQFFSLEVREDLPRLSSTDGEDEKGRSNNGEDRMKPLAEIHVNASFQWGNRSSARERTTGDTDIKQSKGKPYSQVAGEDTSNDTRTEERTFTLEDVNLHIKSGSLVAVLGRVGSGKSTLISALLGEVPHLGSSGIVSIEGSFAYAAQTPWVLNMTLRENVLFGYNYNDPQVRSAYRRAIAGAALLPDIGILPNGDLTEIGERGVNLSGGQKARVSIARALFIASQKADIVLLDDPLSAVDQDVGSHIFHKGISKLLSDHEYLRNGDDENTNGDNDGALNNKIIIISLNSHLHLLPYFNRILIMDQGRIVADDSPSELADSDQGCQLLSNVTGMDSETVKATFVEATMISPTGTPSSTPFSRTPNTSSLNLANSDATSTANVPSSEGDVGRELSYNNKSIGSQEKSQAEAEQDGKLMLKEHREEGAVGWQVYIDYFAAAFWQYIPLTKETIYTAAAASSSSSSSHDQDKEAVVVIGGAVSASDAGRESFNVVSGILVIAGLFTVFTATQFFRVSIDYTLAQWAQTGGNPDSTWSTAFYSTFGCLCFMLLIRSFYLNHWACASSKLIHATILHKVIQAPIIHFFDVHSTGEVLNKLAKDQEIVDSQVPEFMLQFLINWFQVIFTFILCLWAVPYIAIAVPFLLLGGRYVFLKFSALSRDLKRLESVTRSPIYGSLSETLVGLETIRAYGDTERFYEQHQSRMDTNNNFYFTIWMATAWMTIRLEVTTSIILALVAILAVLLRDNTNAIALGLALAYGIQLTALFQRCVQLTIDVAVYMTSAERILEYLEIPQERSIVEQEDKEEKTTIAATTSDIDVSATDTAVDLAAWPTQGNITFDQVVFGYRHLPPVLKGISFSIQGGERVGICGRTGAGKSSILYALFRISEIRSGSITIDDHNITRSIPLTELREKMAIIPQDPTLFTGSIRFQLDPFHKYSDEQIWSALKDVHLESVVMSMPGRLQERVQEAGSNLSSGQRQLLCICRALLRQCRILVIDEGTSAVDAYTDDLIQETLRKSAEKQKVTIIAIAHRLTTIRNFDKILVMHDGVVAEYDAPDELLKRGEESHFYNMLYESGDDNEQLL